MVNDSSSSIIAFLLLRGYQECDDPLCLGGGKDSIDLISHLFHLTAPVAS